MTDDEKAAKLASLKAKLKARDGIAGYKDNVAQIKRMIAELEA